VDEGHCGLPTDQLIPLAEELLEAPNGLIPTALELERSEGAVIADNVGDSACIFLTIGTSSQKKSRRLPRRPPLTIRFYAGDSRYLGHRWQKEQCSSSLPLETA
jgi:hypothetical protein